MYLNVEFYRFKNIFFQRSRYTTQLMMINLKNLNNVPKTNTSIVLDCFFYKKEIIEKKKILTKTFTILWNNYLEKISGYMYKSLKLQSSFSSNLNLKLLLIWKYVDLNYSFFDLFNLFQKNSSLSIPIVSLKENIFLKIIILKTTIKKLIINLSKSSFVLKTLFNQFKDYISEKSNITRKSYLFFNMIL
nr:hypothetical protein CcurKRNrm1_p110 [Cryptomonas curvata]